MLIFPSKAQGARNPVSRALSFAGLVLLAVSSPSPAQNTNAGQEVEIEWQTGEKSLRAEQFGAAISHFDRVLKVLKRADFPVEAATWAAIFQDRADAFYGLKQWQHARADYNRVLELTPKNADALAGRAIARKALGDYDGLIADAEKAAQLDPQYTVFLDDARSTVLYRRVLFGFLGLGAVVVALGAIPFFKSLARLAKAG